MQRRMIYLATNIGWFGQYSGYDPLIPQVRRADPTAPVDVVCVQPGWSSRCRGKLLSIYKGFGAAPQEYVAALHRLKVALAADGHSVGHILNGEEALPYLDLFPDSVLQRLVFTFHQPRALWTPAMEQAVTRISHALVLYSRDQDYLSGFTRRRPHVLLLGADTEFFRPPPVLPTGPPSLLYSGVHLRDTDMLFRVLQKLHARGVNARLNFLVPKAHPARRGLEAKFHGMQVNWLSGLGDAQLLALYQSSTLMLLPLVDSGANTAVVEALSCGLPLVTTNVGGIPDYGGGTVFPTVEPDDDERMADLVGVYLSDAGQRQAISQKQREFAVSRMAWPHSVTEHLKFYTSVL